VLAPAPDASPADWLVERLTTFGGAVRSLVPDDFPAYARIRHPQLLAHPPQAGTLEPAAARALAAVLARHTRTPGRCFFAVWEGWGGASVFDRLRAPTFSLPHRRYHLLAGAARDAGDSVLVPPRHQTASLWWPADRAWCVATEVDLYSTVVGCSEAAALELTDCGRYDVAAVGPATPITRADDPWGT
jgi:hypothetical protein